MNDKSPAMRGSRRRPGGMQIQDTTLAGLIRLEIPERLRAILDELDRLDADVDVPRTIAEGCLEEIETLIRAGTAEVWLI